MASTIKTTLNEAPESLNCVHMVVTSGIFTLAMMYHAMRISEFLDGVVTGKLIGMDGVFSGTGNVIPDEGHYSTRLNVLSDRSVHLPLVSMDKTNNGRFALCASSCRSRVFTADICLVNLNVTVHFAMLLIHQFTNQGEYPPGRLVSYPNFSLKLFGTYPATGAGHKEHGMKPITKWRGGLMKYRSGCRRYLIPAELTSVISRSCPMIELCYLLAFRAINAVRIATLKYALQASIIVRIFLVKVFECVFCGFHFRLPNSVYSYIITQELLYVKGYLPLADAHWDWLNTVLDKAGVTGTTRDLAKCLYIGAFIHGYKHGVEDTEIPRAPNGQFQRKQ